LGSDSLRLGISPRSPRCCPRRLARWLAPRYSVHRDGYSVAWPQVTT
jgi:hypothetical protein